MVNMLDECRSVDQYEKLNRISEGTYGVVYRHVLPAGLGLRWCEMRGLETSVEVAAARQKALDPGAIPYSPALRPQAFAEHGAPSPFLCRQGARP